MTSYIVLLCFCLDSVFYSMCIDVLLCVFCVCQSSIKESIYLSIYLTIPLMTDVCVTGKVNAYIKVELDPSDMTKCPKDRKDRKERDVYLYEDKDMHLTPDKKPKLGFM